MTPPVRFCRAVRRINIPLGPSAWDDSAWRDIPPELLFNYMGEKPAHFPKVEVRLAYDDAALCLMFRVEDRYVRAVASAHQDSVYQDSCVEFFFTPGPDLSQGYFNLEMNCGGTMLFHFQKQPRKEIIEIPESECKKITIAHSMPRIVDPEIEVPVSWNLVCKVPLALLEGYCKVVRPTPQALWRVNFYKCADKTSHPHWLTWAPVDLPAPNFHHPQSFGVLQFV